MEDKKPPLFPAPASPPPNGGSSTWGKFSPAGEESRFLEGPHGRGSELMRGIRIFLEFIRGFRALHFVGPCVTVFGSARFCESNPYYQLARDMGQRLGREGFTVMTGGGPGIMEAANRGAREVKARSIGCNIKLPKEQKPNPYVDRWIEFNYFFVRKVMLIKYSYAFIALPGGFGTLDEIFETATLIQTKKIRDFPLILMGVDYWSPLLAFLKSSVLKKGAIDEEDLHRIVLTDSPERAMEEVLRYALGPAGLHYGVPPRRSWLFGEVE